MLSLFRLVKVQLYFFSMYFIPFLVISNPEVTLRFVVTSFLVSYYFGYLKSSIILSISIVEIKPQYLGPGRITYWKTQWLGIADRCLGKLFLATLSEIMLFARKINSTF